MDEPTDRIPPRHSQLDGLVDPTAQHQVAGWFDAWQGLTALLRFVLAQLRRLDAWVLGDPRRSLGALGAIAAAILLATALNKAEPSKSEDPPPPGFFTYIVVKNDVPNVVAARFSVPFDVFVDDNLALFAKRAEDCQQRNVSANYLAGNLKNGKNKRRSEFCTVEMRSGVEVAVSSFHIGDKVLVRCTQTTENLEACMPASLLATK